MHKEFGEWFNAAGIPHPANTLLARWQALESFEFERSEIVHLTKLFFDLPNASVEFEDRFRVALHAKDVSFRMKGNPRELAVLAGALLASTSQDRSNTLCEVATIAILACSAQGLRPTPIVPEILAAAKGSLFAQAVQRRSMSNLNDDEADEDEDSVARIQNKVDLLSEEVNILWWLFAEHSRDLEVRWKALSPEVSSIVAGKELTDLVQLVPGHAASAALLDKLIQTSTSQPAAELGIVSAINLLPLDWRKDLLQKFPSVELNSLRPVLKGIAASVESAGGKCPSSFARANSLRAGKLTPSKLAYQVYLECLLEKAWADNS